MTSITVCGVYFATTEYRRIRVSATENRRIFNTRSSAKLQTTWYKMLSSLSWCTCKIRVLFFRMERFIDRSVEAYFFGPSSASGCWFHHQTSAENSINHEQEVAYGLLIGTKIGDLQWPQRPYGHHCALFRAILQHSEPASTKSLKLDPLLSATKMSLLRGV